MTPTKYNPLQSNSETDQPFAFDWGTLSQPLSFEKRNAVDPRRVEKASYDLIDQIVALINQESQIIYFEAQLAADIFMQGIQNRMTSENDAEKRTFIRPHIRLTAYYTIDISWVRLVPGRTPLKSPIPQGKKVFYKFVNGKKLPFAARSERISRGKSSRYGRSLFKKEPEWVLDLIELCENKFEYLRKKSETLSELRKAAYKLNYANKKLYDEVVGYTDDRYLPKTPEEYRSEYLPESDVS